MATTHRLMVKLPAHSRIQRVFDTSINLVETGNTQAVSTHREYTDDVTATSDSYHVVRTQTTFTITPATAPNDNFQSAWWQARYQNIPTMIYTTGPYFYPRTVENWDDIKAPLMAMTQGSSNVQTQTATHNLFDMLTPASAAKFMLTPDMLLAFAREKDLIVGTPEVTDSVMPSPIGNGNITYHSTYTMLSWDESADDAEAEYDFQPDPQMLSALMKTLLPTLMGQGVPKATLDKVVADIKVENRTHCHYSVAISTGLIRKAECQMNSIVHVLDYDQSRVTNYTISETLLP